MLKRAIFTSIFLCALIATPTHGDVRQFIDNGTIVAGEVDLAKADPAALEQFFRAEMTAAGLIGKSPTALRPQEVEQTMSAFRSAFGNLTSAGAKHIYIVANIETFQQGPPPIIVPVEAGGDAKKLASVLYSGKPNGPTSAPANQARSMPPQFQFRSEIIGGNLVVYGNNTSVNYVKNLKPAERAEFTAALTALGDAPVKLVVSPPLPVRMMMSKGLPEKIFEQPTTLLTNDALYLAASATLPPNVSIKAFVQTPSPESANGLHQMATGGLAAMSGVPPQISPDLAKLLTPTVQNDQLVLTADNQKLLAIAQELAIPMAQSRQWAVRVQTMSNMRQVLQACIMYAADNKGKYPDDLKNLDRYLGGRAKMVMANPLHPELNPPFVYLKPPGVRAEQPAERIVLYETHKDFGDGICVGFLDGHVEWMSNKQRFDDLVAKTALDDPGQ